MTRYLVQPRDQIFVKGYGVLYFAKSMYGNIGKNISKILSDKYSEKVLDHAKQSATDAFKTAIKRATQKIAEAAGGLIGDKITNKIMEISKSPQQNNSETVKNKHDEEIPKESYMSPEER